MLAQGAEKFGPAVADEKRHLVQKAIRTILAEHPENGSYAKRRKLYHYEVSDAPFVIVYQFDDDELRVLFIVHKRADRRRLKAANAEW